MKENRRQQKGSEIGILDRETDQLFQEEFQEQAKRLEAEATKEPIEIPDDRASQMLEEMLGKIRSGQLGEEARQKLDAPAGSTAYAQEEAAEETRIIDKGEEPEEDTEELLQLGRALKESGKKLEDILREMPAADHPPDRLNEVLEDTSEAAAEKPARPRRRVLSSRKARIFAGAAAALAVVCAVTLSTSANRMYWVELFSQIFGNDAGVAVDNEAHYEEGLFREEDQALDAIKEQIGIEPLYFSIKPTGLRYDDAELNEEMGWGKMFYTYNDLIMTVNMRRASREITSTTYYDGEEIGSFQGELYDGTPIVMRKIQRDAEHTAYALDFERNNAFYSMIGDMEEEVFTDLVKNIRFW